MNTEEKELYIEALKLTGESMQIMICIEEMNELSQALIKYLRNDGFAKYKIKDSIAEELGDVQIMIDQMAVTFDIEKEIHDFKIKKLERLKTRIAMGLKNKGGN